uniref:E74-like ETS transcription factor 3 isoform 11 n=1 Tax=Homo sapiens TaxID=9606 RepID=A0A8E8R9M5_HUMAN|nr:E74-like ETS transcription factor 3 isoform 11 [Homo sapiens]QWF36734.1 E74-like ETS transcription factor 3 isoform 11 [Homo sapiens]
MAATCEISNIFSNYFSAMYSSEDSTLASVPPAATFGADDLVLTLSNPQMSLEGTGTTTNGRSWNGWMAGDSSTSLAKTQAAGRRKRFSRVGTEGWNYTRDQTHGPLEACKPSWEDRQARWPLHWGMLPAVLWREADVLVYCQPSSWDSETMASPPHPPLGITSPGV